MKDTMKEAYCYVSDLLGFKNIIINLESDKQCRRVDAWIEFVNKGADKFGIQNYHMISDTIFAIADGHQGLETLLDFSKYMLEEGMKKSFPIRGGITFGDVNWRPHVVFGKAIIEAYNLANRQNWVGTSCDLDLSQLHGLWDVDKVILYIPPMKNGLAKFMPVSSWNMPSCNKVLSNMSIEGLASEHDIAESRSLRIVVRRLGRGRGARMMSSGHVDRHARLSMRARAVEGALWNAAGETGLETDRNLE